LCLGNLESSRESGVVTCPRLCIGVARGLELLRSVARNLQRSGHHYARTCLLRLQHLQRAIVMRRCFLQPLGFDAPARLCPEDLERGKGDRQPDSPVRNRQA
jgi:hypothetical protein